MYQNQVTKPIGLLYIDTKYQVMKSLYDTIQLMTPDLLNRIKIIDLKNVSPNQYPNLVTKYKQLPLLVTREIPEPIIGNDNIKKWIASTYSVGNGNQSSYEKKNHSSSSRENNQMMPQNNQKDMMYEGYSMTMFGGISSQYEAFDNNYTSTSNFENLNYNPQIDIRQEFMRQNTNSSANDKKEDLTKKMTYLENQRKNLNISSNNNSVVNIK